MSYEIDESRESKYGVDLIGQIDANLTHLRGYGVMALELIQNADDAGANEISLDITDHALIVRNNAEFSSCADRQSDNCLNVKDPSGEKCDWHAFRLIASRAKSERSVTTIGRFGLGFTSVYQITDNPEVESSESKLIIYPDKELSKWRRTTNQPGTTFTLPWAFDATAPVRSQLRNVGVVRREELPDILSEINKTSSESLVFLKNLKKISILSNGKAKSVFTRNYIESKNLLTITQQPSGKISEYFYISGNFSSALNFLELRFPRDLGGKNRRHDIEIAIPREFDASKSGLIYAYLPTERATLMPLSLNGDFYPDSSRKDIILDKQSGNDAYSEWNRAIIENSASLFTNNIENIYGFLGYKNFWKLIQSIFDLSEQIDSYGSDVANCFRTFWTRFALLSGSLSIVPIEGREEQSASIENSCLLEGGEDIKEKRLAIRLLKINAPSSKIKHHFPLLKQLNIDEIDFNIIVGALSRAPWVINPEDKILPTDPKFQDIYLPIYTLLDSYIPKDATSLILRDSLVKFRLMPILISQNGSLETPRDLYFSESAQIQNLALQLDSKLKFLSSELSKFNRIKGSCHEFLVGDSINLVEKILNEKTPPSATTIESIHDLLSMTTGTRTPSDEDLESLRQLSIWPTTDGALISAAVGLIPGDFSDPLGNAEIIDVAKLQKNPKLLLTDILKVKVLSLESYVENVLPTVFSTIDNRIDIESYQKLLEELSKHHKKFENKDLVSKMQTLLLIPNENGEFTRISSCAIGSNADRSRLSGIFDDWFSLKYRPNSKVVHQFLVDLGLRETPDSKILETVLRNITSEIQNTNNRAKVIRIIDYLVDKKNSYTEAEISALFSSLSATGFLPAKGDFEYWYSPEDVLSPEVIELISSQTHLKILDFCGVDLASMDNFISKCGVRSEPDVIDVVAHVRHCADSELRVSNKILKYLNRVAAKRNDEESIAIVRSLREVTFLPTQEGIVQPADLYRELHKIGAPWAFKLPKEIDFPDLINALGIKQAPDGDDLIRILTRIHGAYIASGEPQLSERSSSAYIQSWEMLNNLCLQENLSESQLVVLMDSDLFLNERKVFSNRTNLVIADSEWFRQEFSAEFGEYFVLDNHLYSEVLEKLGFRYLSKNLSAKLSTIEEPVLRLENLKQEISSRSRNIFAALTRFETSDVDSQEWTKLDVYQAGSISVEWSLAFSNDEVSVVKPGNVFADFRNRKLYVTDKLSDIEDRFNWTRMYKELFDQLFPAESNVSLSGTVAIVSGLMNLSPEHGVEYLKDVGISITPRENSVDLSKVNVVEIKLQPQANFSEDTPFGENEGYSDGKDIESPAGNLNESAQVTSGSSENPSGSVDKPSLKSSEHHDRSQQSSTTNDGHSENHGNRSASSETKRIYGEQNTNNNVDRPRRVDSTRNPDRESAEIREAYIYVQREPSLEAIETQKNKMESESISRRIVMQHEAGEGRAAEEMASDNEGYDIESTESDGTIRFIEIKSTKSLWSKDGITLSFAQLNWAFKKKDAYWLYVIEKIGTPTPRIYKIQNPARHIRGFKLNDAWKEIAISLEEKSSNNELFSNGISEEDIGSRIFHVEKGECFLIGWRQMGASVLVTLLFDEIDEHIVLPLNITKMKRLES